MDKRSNVVIGVDVSLRRGLDVVVLDESSRVVEARARLAAEDLGAVIAKWLPAAIGIDSPPGPGRRPSATSRAGERALRQVGINVFLTPSDPAQFSGPFYDWVRAGMLAFEVAAAAGYPVQNDPAVVRGRALEVFPHAADVFLRGCLPPAGTSRRQVSKRLWRTETLQSAGVITDALCKNRSGQPTLDSVDAALAAITARRSVDGDFSVFGDDGEWIVVPSKHTGRFTRHLSALP